MLVLVYKFQKVLWLFFIFKEKLKWNDWLNEAFNYLKKQFNEPNSIQKQNQNYKEKGEYIFFFKEWRK